jgi:hypothetical protein
MVIMVRRMAIAAVVMAGFIFASCSSPPLTSAQQQYVTELRGKPAHISSQTSDQTLVNAGKTVCADVGNGLTQSEVESRFGLNLYTEASVNAVVDAAVDHLCPRFKGQLPKS